MPENSAQVKIDAVRNYGATLDLVDTRKTGRNERVAELARQMPDAYFASAYDDRHVIEGNSTLGEELAEKDFDIVIAPIGGGGLSSGIVTGLNRNEAETKVIGAEPLLGNDAALSMKAGKIVVNEFEPLTIADGARTISLGKLNWEILRNGLEEIIEVSEEKIAEGVRLYFSMANLKVEPAGALTLGAILEMREKFAGKKVCAVVSGGNVDVELYRQILGQD